MKRKKNRKEDAAFDVWEGFMVKVAGTNDEVVLCGHMVGLLHKIRDIFLANPVPHSAFQLLERAGECTENTFRGNECEDLFDVYYQLGVVLIEIGQEDLGLSCQFLHHVYRNRAMIQWPPAKAWYRGRGDVIMEMLPIFEGSFEDLEADTARDGDCVPT
jgi:hypothetical protein